MYKVKILSLHPFEIHFSDKKTGVVTKKGMRQQKASDKKTGIVTKKGDETTKRLVTKKQGLLQQKGMRQQKASDKKK